MPEKVAAFAFRPAVLIIDARSGVLRRLQSKHMGRGWHFHIDAVIALALGLLRLWEPDLSAAPIWDWKRHSIMLPPAAFPRIVAGE